MVRWRRGTVTGVRRTWPGACELDVVVTEPDGRSAPPARWPTPRWSGSPGPATPSCSTPPRSTAPSGRAGTRSWWRCPTGSPPTRRTDPATWSRPATPRCRRWCSASTSRSPTSTSCCARPTTSAGCRWWWPTCTRRCRPCSPAPGPTAPRPRAVYVMTDGGALPAWFSRSAATLREQGWLAATVSVGQAFGGDLEAVTLHTGLLAARHVLGADLVVVAQGPGNLGTGTRWGFSGVAAGEAVNAAAVLGGRPVASLRVSGADPRGRHAGVSHHSLTAYGRVALAPADVVVPDLAGARGGRAGRAGAAGGAPARRAAGPAPAGAGGVRRPAGGAARGARWGCRRWAAASTTTPRRSSPPPPPAVTRLSSAATRSPRAEVGPALLGSLAGAPSLGATEPTGTGP